MALLMSGCFTSSQAQSTNAFALWPGDAPGALGKADRDIPTLTPYFPSADKATGAALIICPGGGYTRHAEHEGKHFALWLNEYGITCFVLKYRVGANGYHHPIILGDAARAVRIVRAKAADWKLDPKRIGIMGSSAGGHLASTLLTHFDNGKPDAEDPIERKSSRPDLGILCYPVITMGQFTHQGSRDNLLGSHPTPELVKEVSNELNVTPKTPPCFIWHTEEDQSVPVENSLLFAEALRKADVSFALHIYQKGGHGMGLGSRTWDPDHRHPWAQECILWLTDQGFVNRPRRPRKRGRR